MTSSPSPRRRRSTSTTTSEGRPPGGMGDKVPVFFCTWPSPPCSTCARKQACQLGDAVFAAGWGATERFAAAPAAAQAPTTSGREGGRACIARYAVGGDVGGPLPCYRPDPCPPPVPTCPSGTARWRLPPPRRRRPLRPTKRSVITTLDGPAHALPGANWSCQTPLGPICRAERHPCVLHPVESTPV